MTSRFGVYVVRDNGAYGGYRVNAWVGTIYYQTKFFADIKNGGKKKASAKAKTYQDHLKNNIPAGMRKAVLKVKRHGLARGKGYYLVTAYTVHGEPYKNWVAMWVDHATGEKRRRSFAVNKWGFNEARRRAKQARESGIKNKLILAT